MCGLAGWFGLNMPDKQKQEEFFRLLMRKAQVRGTDSFGVAFAQGQNTKIHRGLGPVSKWLAKDRKLVRRAARSSIVVGHTRAASRGDVTLVNAHPFRVGGWLAAHNGSIQNGAELMLTAAYAPKGECDSEEALTYLVTNGFSAESFLAIRGWYAWTAMRDDASEILIAVDARTPFAIARVGGGIVWHSLSVALESSLAAVGITTQVVEIKNTLLRFPSGEAIDLVPRPTPATESLRGIDTREVRHMQNADELQLELEEFDD